MISATQALEKKASDVIIYNVGEASSISDYIIICSGSSDRHVKAIADNVSKHMKELGHAPLSIEGYSDGNWVLVDLDDIIMHVFYQPIREYFRLEELWSGAERLEIPAELLNSLTIGK